MVAAERRRGATRAAALSAFSCLGRPRAARRPWRPWVLGRRVWAVPAALGLAVPFRGGVGRPRRRRLNDVYVWWGSTRRLYQVVADAFYEGPAALAPRARALTESTVPGGLRTLREMRAARRALAVSELLARTSISAPAARRNSPRKAVTVDWRRHSGVPQYPTAAWNRRRKAQLAPARGIGWPRTRQGVALTACHVERRSDGPPLGVFRRDPLCSL